MMKNYFENCNTNETFKIRLKELVKALHPDNGGDAEEFKEMMQQFKEAEKHGWHTFTNKDGETYEKETVETPEEFAEVLSKIIHFEGITIEIIGSWVWLTGNTFQYKDQIKAAGFWYSKSKSAWYYTGEKEHHKRRGHYNMKELRQRYGSKEVKTEEQEKITAA